MRSVPSGAMNAIGAGDLARPDRVERDIGMLGQEGRDKQSSPSSGSSEQLEKTMRPPGFTMRTALASSRCCRSASFSMSAGVFVQGTSG